MPFEQRRAYFEFASKTELTITTNYHQKSFKLTEDCIIDLFNLTKSKGANWHNNNGPSNFFAVFTYDHYGDMYIGDVIGKVNAEEITELDDSKGNPLILDWKENNKKNVKFKVWYD